MTMAIKRELQSVVVVHFNKDDTIPDFYVFGDERVRLFIVDENAPDDRVYEELSRKDISKLRELIPEGTVIGSSQDDRHKAIVAHFKASLEGRRHPFNVIDGGGNADQK